MKKDGLQLQERRQSLKNMQGFHEDNMLFIVDEASGVADPIMEAILGTLSGSNNKLLMCGILQGHPVLFMTPFSYLG